jgi:hypothetical protein
MRQRSGPAPGEAFPFSRRRWIQRWTRCIKDSEVRSNGQQREPSRDRHPLGTMAAAAGAAAMMAESSFGALSALTATAMGVGWAAELFGTGGFGLGEAFASRPPTSNGAVGLSAPAVIQMA